MKNMVMRMGISTQKNARSHMVVVFGRLFICGKIFFEENITYVVGDGSGVMFLENKWLCDEPLMRRVPVMFKPTRSENSMVNHIIKHHVGGI